jgi:hypothetical protein
VDSPSARLRRTSVEVATVIEADAAAIVAAVELRSSDVETAAPRTPAPRTHAPRTDTPRTDTTRTDTTRTDALSAGQRAILDFERRWWRQPGAKDQAIRDNFEMSPTRYYQTLNALLDLAASMTYDAALVNRLQRLRASATRSRRLR